MNYRRAPFQPIIIIGAGRSGTNMLRDLLTQLPEMGTWPCDEINYIWRHGNITFPTDEFGPQHARLPNKQFIQHQFQQLAEQQKVPYVVEKTCANSLRVCYVDEIFPNAKYISIVRDGNDVVASALKRWHAPLDIKYIAAKARYVPFSDIPYYGWRYIGNRLYRLGSREKRLAFWGPRFVGMDELLRQESLPIVCAHQWKRCVERAEEDFQQIDLSRVFSIQYEHLVDDAHRSLSNLLDFLQIEVKNMTIAQLTQDIRPDSVGKWRTDLSDEIVAKIQPVIHGVQTKYGYS